jgi:hypothetical protein
MKLCFEGILSVCSCSLVILFMISGQTAWGGTVTGTATSSDELKQTVSKWKFHMANTAHKQDVKVREKVRTKSSRGESETVGRTYKVKGTTYGTFFWCPLTANKDMFRYAYSYGEADPEMATTKAAHAFDAERGKCSKDPRVLKITSDDL